MSRLDDRGAITLLALVFAVLALALVYAVVGTAHTLWFRERLQDAADASALEGAVSLARSMNLLVLINLVMAALLAILITIKLLEGLAIIGMAVAVALSWISAGFTLTAVPPLGLLRSQMATLYDSLKPPVFSALQVLHDVAGVVHDIAPGVATLLVATSDAASSPPVTLAIALPSATTLPVEDDTFKKLCAEAGTMPLALANDMLGPLNLGAVLNPLESAMGDMTSALSFWFCGDGGAAPPTFEQSTDPVYPRLAAGCDPGASGNAPPPTDAACAAAHRFQEQAKPDPETGACQPGMDCSLGGPYDQRVIAARTQCVPTQRPAPTQYWYQVRTGTVMYTWTKVGWVRGEPAYETPSEKSVIGPPCGPPSVHPLIDGYNSVVRRTSDVKDVLPVCSDEKPPGAAPQPARLGAEAPVKLPEVLQILACRKHETVRVNVAVGETGTSGKDKDNASRTPMKVQEGVSLGDPVFQIRAVAKGDVLTLGTEDAVVRIASWQAKDSGLETSTLRGLGSFAVAQAEYFYDARDDRAEWMWNMKWRARLRRFRLPETGATDALRALCTGDFCDGLFSTLSAFSDVSVH